MLANKNNFEMAHSLFMDVQYLCIYSCKGYEFMFNQSSWYHSIVIPHITIPLYFKKLHHSFSEIQLTGDKTAS